MTTVKLKKIGNTTVLTIPKTIKPRFDSYEVFSGRDGAIVFLPEKTNPFTNEKFITSHSDSLIKKATTKTELIDGDF